MKHIIILICFFLSSCSILLDKTFLIADAKMRDFRVNKIKDISTFEKFNHDESNQYAEIIFNANIDLLKLMVGGGYAIAGRYKYNNHSGHCIVYGENHDLETMHFSLADLMLKRKNAIYNSSITPDVSIYKYSCVINKSIIKGNEILFNVELTGFTKSKYKSNYMKIENRE